MDKKGMTLLELIGVIVLVATLALIAIPITLGIVDKTEMGSFRDSANGLIEAGQIYASSNSTEVHNNEIAIFKCNGNYCGTDNGEILDFKGETPIGGQIVVYPNDPTKLIGITNGKYCAAGTATTLKIAKVSGDEEYPCGSVSEEAPTINKNKANVEVTSSTAKITLSNDFAIDEAAGIVQYKYELILNGKVINTKESKKPSITFKKLTKDTEYSVKITVLNSNGLESETTILFRTLDMDLPQITTNKSNLKNGYYDKQEISIKYVSGMTNYVKATREGTINKVVKESCGKSKSPGICTKIEGTKELEANTWYKVDKDVKVTFNKQTEITSDYIVATSYDGTNYSGSSSFVLSMIDNENPTLEYSIGNGTYKLNEGNPSSYNIVITGDDSLHYTGMEIEVYKDGKRIQEIKNNEKKNTISINSNGVYKIKSRVSDNAGHIQDKEPNESGWYYQEYVMQIYTRDAKCGIEAYKECATEGCGSYQYQYPYSYACGTYTYAYNCSTWGMCTRCDQVMVGHICNQVYTGGGYVGTTDCTPVYGTQCGQYGCLQSSTCYGTATSYCTGTATATAYYKCRHEECGVEQYNLCWHT